MYYGKGGARSYALLLLLYRVLGPTAAAVHGHGMLKDDSATHICVWCCMLTAVQGQCTAWTPSLPLLMLYLLYDDA